MKRILNVGPHECLGICKVLKSFGAPDRTERRVASDMFSYFLLDKAKLEEINWHELTLTEKKELGIPPEDMRSGWDKSVTSSQWKIELSGAEWSVLSAAMDKFSPWTIDDNWERGVSDQLAVPEIPRNEKGQ